MQDLTYPTLTEQEANEALQSLVGDTDWFPPQWWMPYQKESAYVVGAAASEDSKTLLKWAIAPSGNSITLEILDMDLRSEGGLSVSCLVAGIVFTGGKAYLFTPDTDVEAYGALWHFVADTNRDDMLHRHVEELRSAVFALYRARLGNQQAEQLAAETVYPLSRFALPNSVDEESAQPGTTCWIAGTAYTLPEVRHVGESIRVESRRSAARLVHHLGQHSEENPLEAYQVVLEGFNRKS